MKGWTGLVVCACLLMGGCQMGDRAVAKDTKVIHRGEMVQCFEMVRVEDDGRTVFRNADMGDQGETFAVRAGHRFGLQVERRRGRITEYGFTVLSSDVQKQEVVMEATVEERKGSAGRGD